MIKQISENLYRVKINKTSYDIGITERHTLDGCRCGYTINRRYMHSFWRSLSLEYRAASVARMVLKEYAMADWRGCLWFESKKAAISFLYYIDKHYNPTPQKVEDFINIELWRNL